MKLISNKIVVTHDPISSQDPGPRYYVYPIHLSWEYVITHTLSSVLFLLLLFFQSRRYRFVIFVFSMKFINNKQRDAIELVPSCVTDDNLQEHELLLFRELFSLVGDTTPDAHAFRLKLWLKCYNNVNIICEWDVSVEMSNYLQMENLVSVECRLSIDEQVCLFLFAISLIYFTLQ
jgi:hypothetical protein